MGNYTLTAGQARYLVDHTSTPIPEGATSVAIVDPAVAALGATGGSLTLLPQGIGQTDVTITPNGGAPVTHTVTVVASPFDWSLGDPV